MLEKQNAKQNINTNNFLLGRKKPINIPSKHHFNGRRILPPWPKNFNRIVLGKGCFWGVEETFRKLSGVKSTAVGYSGGNTTNPTYESICQGNTNHADVVKLDFDEKIITYEKILKTFFQIHDPTTLNSQGPDFGTQYRSEIFYLNDTQKKIAEKVLRDTNVRLSGKIVTKISLLKNYISLICLNNVIILIDQYKNYEYIYRSWFWKQWGWSNT